jgi:hypothetical protein
MVFSTLFASAATYFLLRPTEPFQFLYGTQPVSNNDRSDWDPGVKQIVRDYAFRGDFDAVKRDAERELIQRGFTLERDDYDFGPRCAQYKCKQVGPNNAQGDFVNIFKDMHYKLPQFGEPYSLVGYDEIGWVSVQVYVTVKRGGVEKALARLQSATVR